MDEEPRTDEPLFQDTLAKMTHEMRTPLTTIMGFSELLLEEDSIEGTSREYLQMISSEARRMSEILNEYISILRTERVDDEFED